MGEREWDRYSTFQPADSRSSERGSLDPPPGAWCPDLACSYRPPNPLAALGCGSCHDTPVEAAPPQEQRRPGAGAVAVGGGAGASAWRRAAARGPSYIPAAVALRISPKGSPVADRGPAPSLLPVRRPRHGFNYPVTRIIERDCEVGFSKAMIKRCNLYGEGTSH